MKINWTGVAAASSIAALDVFGTAWEVFPPSLQPFAHLAAIAICALIRTSEKHA